jgi:hypothetical protein
LFVSNNEATRLQWYDVEKSKRYVDLYGLGQSDNFKRQVVGNGWIPHYRELQGGMRQGLGSQGTWSQNAKFVGYNAFGTAGIGRTDSWTQYSLYIPGRIDPSPLAWDGTSPSYYLYNPTQVNDYWVCSPQIESMNWLFMLQQAYSLNPGFWFELSTWDGGTQTYGSITSLGQTYTPERYGGYVQFGMWLLRPRVVREYRSYDDTVANAGPYFLAVVQAVDSVHKVPLLRKFWRSGTLVANHAWQHPYESNFPAEYQSVDRWFLLDTSLDPKHPWSYYDTLPIYCLAIVLGQAPQREWLVYAYSPVQPRQNVGVTLPDYGQITINSTVSGAFYHVVEQTKGVDPIVTAPSPPGSVHLNAGQ